MSGQTITISAKNLFALFDAVVPMAGNDRGYPVLNCVRLESRESDLLAIATDRYSLGIQRLPKGEEPWPEFAANIPLHVIRSIKAMFKPSRGSDSDLTLTLTADLLTVEAGGALMDMLSARASYLIEQGEFPRVVSVILDAAEREPSADEFALNPKVLRSFVHLSESLSFKGHASSAVFVTSGENFVGAVMPRRRVSDFNAAELAAEWKALLEPLRKGRVDATPAKKDASKEAAA